MEILVPEPESFSEKCINILAKVGNVTAKKINRKKLLEIIDKFDILVIRLETKIDKEILDKAKKLKIIGVATTGLDHIDVEHAKSKGIKIVSLKGERKFLESINASAEHGFALLLALIRKIPWAFEETKQERWTRAPFFGKELCRKTMGIIGLGRLGSKIARMAKCFGMRVLAYDPYVSKLKIEKLGVKKVGLKTLLKKSDVIMVCAALTSETENLLSFEEFKQMRLKPILVNIARGKIVDEKALLGALKKGQISGAALDVLSGEVGLENPLKDNPLVKYTRKHNNLLITPHLGGATFESMEATGMFIAKKIKTLVNSGA
jgi:D-3-phosphoglycerate dehydrogenase